MKQILKYLTIALMAIAMASCTDKSAGPQEEPTLPVTPTNINGKWQLVEWIGQEIPETRYFYIEFIRRGMLFKSYENTKSHEVRKETGVYDINIDEVLGGAVISGKYDYFMEQGWDHSYIVTDLTADRMVWTVLGNPEDVSVYARVDSIPSEITGETAE